MIAHLVLMNLRDPADGPFVTEQIRSLAGRVPGLHRADGGPSLVNAAASWDLGFLMAFDSVEAVESYQSHPAHIEVAGKIRDRVQEMGTCDLHLDPNSLG